MNESYLCIVSKHFLTLSNCLKQKELLVCVYSAYSSFLINQYVYFLNWRLSKSYQSIGKAAIQYNSNRQRKISNNTNYIKLVTDVWPVDNFIERKLELSTTGLVSFFIGSHDLLLILL